MSDLRLPTWNTGATLRESEIRRMSDEECRHARAAAANELRSPDRAPNPRGVRRFRWLGVGSTPTDPGL